MNLLQLRTEVLAHGFDATQYGARITNYINNSYLRVARRVSYFLEEASQTVATTAGTATFPWPANFARLRSLDDTDRQVELRSVSLRDIDRSAVTQGTPNYYAMDGQNIRLYPTPDGVHNLLLRYWLLPTPLSADTDVPTLPDDYHQMLADAAIARCYWGDDDAAMGQQWDAKFERQLAEFEADVRFPSDDRNWVAAGMWDEGHELGGNSTWSAYGF